jgi:hypothetical protein
MQIVISAKVGGDISVGVATNNILSKRGLELKKSQARKKLYVGCSLTHSSRQFKDRVETLKARLSKQWEVMQFLGLSAGTEIDVYRVDILENVGGCDAFLGIIDEPAWGLGWETHEAVMKNKPTLLVAHTSTRVTRLALALPHYFPGKVHVRRYENILDDVPKMVDEAFSEVSA